MNLVQREVDVAIAMRPIRILLKDQDLKGIVLLAGDGDFHDMVDIMINNMNKKVYVVGWRSSMNRDLFKMCSGEVIYLDDIWDNLTNNPRIIVDLPINEEDISTLVP